MSPRPKPALRHKPRATEAANAPPACVDLGPLPDLVGYVLRRAQIAVFQDFVQTMAALDIRPAQYSVMLVIALNPGVNQTQISDALGIKTANLAVMLNALAARGFAERRPGAADRRAHALHLTARGKLLMRQLQTRVADHESRIVDRLGAAEKQQLLTLLAKLI